MKRDERYLDKAQDICLRDTRVLAYFARATTLFEAFVNVNMRFIRTFSL